MTAIYVTNRSTLISERDAQYMTSAVNHQMVRDVAPAWKLPPTPVIYAKLPPPGSRIIVILDTADDPQALGYHTDTGIPAGVVGVKPELDQGAKTLSGPYSVSSILSHEVLEMAVDPTCALWADSGNGYLVAYEVGDPVQSDHYDIDQVTVSNFVYPDFFNSAAPLNAKVDHLGKLNKPFTLSSGGYWVKLQGGQASQEFGAQMPDWLKATKQIPASRTQRHSPAVA